jgi:hypothetical protein
MDRETYDHFEHRHRFAVWAGARAAQRAFTTVENLRDALESTTIRAFLLEPASLEIDAQSFETCHRKWCNTIVKFLSGRGIEKATFGRAAKLIAVYLKAMVVIGVHSQSRLAAVAHPPIDRVLLQNLASSPEIESPHKSKWRATTWTTLDERSYYELISELRSVVPDGEPLWKLEQYWTVTND